MISGLRYKRLPVKFELTARIFAPGRKSNAKARRIKFAHKICIKFLTIPHTLFKDLFFK